MGISADDYITRLSQRFGYQLVANAISNIKNKTASLLSKVA
jgi:hypothetical protein